ncbi:unnamed protein product [Owenia fusiformis]|uniref:Uncharacterized protein n=1 Tax=Owenia fusiformis TaxID=6347 RepID=A0A8J1TNE9_OWEFU|nr:unnamed protein product [Owenia fusiformis]
MYVFLLTEGISFVASGEDIVVIKGPQDRAVFSGQNTELTCHIDPIASGATHVVQWIGHTNRTGVGKPLSVNDRITVTDIPNKFSIHTEKPYNLGLQNTDLDDAGKYTCNNVLIGAPIGGLEPQLVVLGERDGSQKPTITWTLNGIEQTATPDETTPGVFKSTFTKTASSVDNQKELNCSLRVLNIQQHCSTRLNIQYPALKPTLFVNGNNIPDQAILQRTVGTNVLLKGESLANPNPTYIWQFRTTSDPNFSTGEFGDAKHINNIQFNQAGIYRCCASNNLNGYRECSELTIYVVGSSTGNIVGGVLGSLVAISIIAVLAFFVVKLHNENKRLKKENSLLQKDSNNRTSSTGEVNVVFQQSQNVPYEEVDFKTNTYAQLNKDDINLHIPSDTSDKEYPMETIDIGASLGAGEFGVVKLVNVNTMPNAPFMAAAKILKDNASDDDHRALLRELDLMKQLPKHNNVVELLGYSKYNDQTMILVEYLPLGDLQSYLRANKARDVGERDLYSRTSQGRLPIRWMSPEALFHNIYTTKNDVWAYGILLWEILTFGSTPYTGMNGKEVMEFVKAGKVMDRQQHFKSEIYNVMAECWCHDAGRRPTFSDLVSKMENILQEETLIWK